MVRKSIIQHETIELPLAHKNRLFVLADEVYQENVYLAGSKFYSFKKVMMDMGSPFNQMEMGNPISGYSYFLFSFI